jgi:F-type H+-transporting ATPase subunit delta
VAGAAAARRYAKALFALGRDADRTEEVRAELDALAALFVEVPALRDALFRPLHPVAERRAALDAVAERLSSSADVRHFYAFLIDQRRIVDFPAIHAEYGRLADEAAGRVAARVTSSTPLSDDQQQRLRRALNARTGREVHLEIEVDDALVGGLVARVGDVVFDGSIRTHLQQLRSNLTKGH